MKNLYKNKTKKLILPVIIIISIFTLLVIVFAVSEKRNLSSEVKGVETLKALTFEHKSNFDEINSNFNIPLGGTVNKSVKSVSSTSSENTSENTINTEPKEDLNTPQISSNSIVIPKLNVRTSVIEGIDGEQAIHEGAWLYPNSYAGEGEKIFLGHRRFWGPDDPRSFWNLDQLKSGDVIHYADANGKVYTYNVRSVSVRNAGDHSTLKPSKENMIKVISCATADGSAGSSEKRIVVIATQI